MDIHIASDGTIVQLDHRLSDYDSLEGVYTDAGAATAIVAGNILLFVDDGRELKQDVLEELWERSGSRSDPFVALYLFNRETFFSEPARWAAELREEVVLPPPLDLSTSLDISHAQSPFAVAFDHLCHLQSLFRTQARALGIAYDNLAFHLQPIVDAFREFVQRTDAQLDQQEKLLSGYDVDMAMLPKVVVHEALFRRRDKDGDDSKRKTLVDWIHSKKMEQVRDWCRTAQTDYVNRFHSVAAEMDELELQSGAERHEAENRIDIIEKEFNDALARIELASQQVAALMQADAVDFEQSLLELDSAMRIDLASMTDLKNDFTFDVHAHLRHIADFQVRITKFTRPMAELDHDLRQKNAFPHLERLRSLPFAYAANVVELVHRKEFSVVLVEWVTRLVGAVNTYLATETLRRRQHKSKNQLPWEIPPLEESQTPRLDVTVGGGTDVLEAVPLGQVDIDNLLKWVDGLHEDRSLSLPNIANVENPVPVLAQQIKTLIDTLDLATNQLSSALSAAATPSKEGERPGTSESESYNAELEAQHEAHTRELEERHEQRVAAFQIRQNELQEELARLRTDMSEEMQARQQATTGLEDKTRELEERQRESEDQRDLISALQADMVSEKDRATDLGVRLQEALLDVDGLRNAEHSLINQIKELQEERTRTLTELGEQQLLTQNYESELAGTKAELEVTAAQLVQAQLDRDQALKNQSAEAERMMRDHIAEADGDRAVLEHQNLTLTKELEGIRTQMSEQLNTAKNAAIRREDGLKAELSFTKAQLREVQRRETILSDELAMAKDASMTLSQKETHQAEIARDAVILSGKYHEACHRLMTAISASTTISSSLSLPTRGRSPPPAALSASAGADLRDSSVLVRSLEAASSFELAEFADAVLRTINLARKLSKSCKQYREISRSKITISQFGKGDLVLFLPTRNAAVKAWAAFNISAPHHFLHVTDRIQQQLVGKDYYLARIVSTDEAVVNGDVSDPPVVGTNHQSPETNPYGLAEGLRYYSHHVEEWTPATPRIKGRSQSTFIGAEGRSADSPMTTPAPQRAMSTFLPGRAHTVDLTDPKEEAPSPKEPLTPARSPPPGTSPSPLTRKPTPPTTKRAPPPPLTFSPSPAPVCPGPVVPIPAPQEAASNLLASKLQEFESRSPPPPPTSPIAPRAVSSPITTRRSHRASLASTASPPPRDNPPFAPSSTGRPSSIASSTSSHPPRGSLPIPGGHNKGAPAAAIATSAEGSPTAPPSVGDGSTLGRGIAKKSSVASLQQKSDDSFKPSPLGPKDAAAAKDSKDSSATAGPSGGAPGAAAGGSGSGSGFLSGLSLSRKRQSLPQSSTAIDLLKRLDGGT